MKTRNNEQRKFKIEGTNLITDQVGIDRLNEHKKKFVGREISSDLHKEMTHELRGLLHSLKEEGRLFHKDGFKV